MTAFLIGVDTGGTYTDAAIIEADGHKVVATAKALTTKGDLAIGVIDALTGALAAMPREIDPARVGLVSVSTTLATNAVVEGHGGRVGVILIGFDAEMVERTGIATAFPGMPIVCVVGGHDHDGDEKRPLDHVALQVAALEMKDKVEAFAVASSFAVRNPAHEHEAGALIAATTQLPVTLSTELSSALDAPRRALTATLNARLVSRVSLLIDAVNRAMQSFGLKCPLMIVKGDGTLALADSVARRPIETVLSGPAASLVGARWLSGLDSFILSDMGGTTTDLGVLVDGRPKITAEGAEVGGWRTMVRAIELRTIGLGGDSEVQLAANARIVVGPQRIVPIALLGARHPETIALLQADLADTRISSLHGRFVMRPFGWNTMDAEPDLRPREREILAQIGTAPRPLRGLALASGGERAILALHRKGLIQICGFTPSDAAHVLELQANWSQPAANLAARIITRFRDMKAPTDDSTRAFCRAVWDETVRLSAQAVLATALGKDCSTDVLVDALCRGEHRVGLARISVSPTVPVVAVGGPVKVYYQEVGRRLDADTVFPPYCEVANAVGAATGVTARMVTVTVEGDGSGTFRVHGPDGVTLLHDGAAALAAAEAIARRAAIDAAQAAGADHPQAKISVTKYYLPNAIDENGLLEAELVAEAIGRPHLGE